MNNLPTVSDKAYRGEPVDLAKIDKTERDRLVAGMLLESVASDREYFWTSLPAETREDRITIHKAVSRLENDIDELCNGIGFPVTDCVISKIKYTTEAGNDVTGPKVTLVSDSGDTKSVIARIFCEQFLQLFPIFGLPPWDEPLVIKAKLNKGSGKNRFYSLELV